jgi:NADH-quinone oxidoreductase subunit N
MTLTFDSSMDFLWALLPEAVLAAWAMAVLLAGVWGEEEAQLSHGYVQALAWFSVAGLAMAALLNGWLQGVSVTADAGMITVDGFRLFANWIFLLGAALVVLFSVPYVRRQRLQPGEFYALILLATVGMMVLAATMNLILLFLALETMAIASYALTAFNRRDRRSAEAGLKYFVLGAFSSGFLLYGIALVWGATGSVELSEIAGAVQGGAGFGGLLGAGMALLGVGFAFKVAAVPFHMWAPDVYEGAPTPATALMAASVKAASVVAFMRVFLVAFPGLYESWFPIAWWLAALTMIGANLLALAQSNVKRMLAYSSVAHGGYLLVGLAAGNEVATAGVLFYLFVYTIMTVGAFAILMIVSEQGEERLQLDDFAGYGATRPTIALLLTIFLLSLAGFPGTGGFVAKIYLLQGAVASQLWALAVILALTTVVSYFYYLRVAWTMWMRPVPETTVPRPEVGIPASVRAALLVSAAVILFLGILPGGLLEGALTAANGLGVLDGVLGQVP